MYLLYINSVNCNSTERIDWVIDRATMDLIIEKDEFTFCIAEVCYYDLFHVILLMKKVNLLLILLN